ncbi:2525_t:CDS:2 [Paraglomus occultum]|uniref:2525_t:CDS:1 n=1 Tax=Paraglomus occultum TaxID=144539 RepID=A0A9N9G7A5_9GLOM|nr:2525_t:CDS:2 [Paraglomus occultum]
MWNTESSKYFIKKIIKEYGKEIAQEGSVSALGLEDHLDKMVAKAMNVDKNIITLARQWRVVLERAAFTEGIDKIKEVLGREQEVATTQPEKLNKTTQEIEMGTEEALITEAERDKEIESHGNIRQIFQHQEKVNSNERVADRTKVSEIMKDIQLVENSIEIRPCKNEIEDRLEIHPCKNEIENRLEQLVEIGKSRSGDTSLDCSVWAPKPEACKDKGEVKAKVAAVKILGDNAEQREKSIRWSLRGNKHIKAIQEKFVNGNQWCIIYFDCKGGYEEAKAKLEKKKDEFDQLNLILEEKTEKENLKGKKVPQNEKKMKETRETQARHELKEIQKKRATLYNQTEKGESSTNDISRKRKEVLPDRVEEEETVPIKDKGKRRMYESETLLEEKETSSKSSDRDNEWKPYPRIEETITVWDIPHYISRSQVFFAIKHLGRIKNIEMIRENSGKTRAEVSFEEGSSFVQGIETWVIPLTNDLLVRITPGTNRKEILENRKQFIAKLFNIPQNINEVLLLRQLKHTGAKAVHVFKNSNGNNKGYALTHNAKPCEILDSEEKYKQEQYTQDLNTRGFKRREPTSNKSPSLYRSKKKITREKVKSEDKRIQALERKLSSFETLVNQEGKLERQMRAETSTNQDKEKYRKGTERGEGRGRLCDENRDRREKQESIKIGAHNINGTKEDNTKVELLAEYGEQEGKWINTKEYGYSSFWTETEKGKHKGSGIGLLVDQNWLRNMGVCKRFSPYLLKAEFFFRKVVFQVWIVYLPPKNEEVTKKVHKILIEEITKNRKNTIYTILGDFNTVLNERLDMSSKGKRNADTGTRITKWLKNTDHIETFRFCNPELIKYSWSNGNVSTRIDHIWTTLDMRSLILDSNIEQMETVTDSDHGIVWLQLDSTGILEKNKQRSKKGQKETRRLYQYHKATEEDWNNYSQELIAKAIQAAASKHIPSTKTQNSKSQIRKEATKSLTYSRAKVLGRIFRKGSKDLGQSIDGLERAILNARIEHLNTEYKTNIPRLPESWNKEYCIEIKEWWNVLKEKARKEMQAAKEKEIKEKIEERFALMPKNQKQMLNKLLERPHNKIIVDRVLVQGKNKFESKKLVTESDDIKREVERHFKEQFRKRKHQFEQIDLE